MVPIGSLASIQETNGPLVLTRYNMYPAASINGVAGPGMSSGQAIDVLAGLANRELPRNMAFEWTDMSYLEVIAGDTAMLHLRLRRGDGVSGAGGPVRELVAAAGGDSRRADVPVERDHRRQRLPQMDVNIFTRIGFVVLVGLASKNAILIVEFAKVQRRSGRHRREATLEACRLRLRPIVMTSLAFILGVLPLIVSRGAGAEMRQTLGTAVFSGMLGVTLFGLLLTPVFFYSIDWLGERTCSARSFDATAEPVVAGAGVAAARSLVTAPESWSRLVAAPTRPSCGSRRTNGHDSGNGANGHGSLEADRSADSDLRRAFCESRDRGAELTKSPTSSGWSADFGRTACFRRFSLIGRSSPPCCRSSSRWRAGSRLLTLPVAQYPEITPPTVEVSAVYPGANAQVVADTVAAPIEQQVNGVENMLYMSSQCTNDGTYTLTVTFKNGVDLNMAQVLVENRVSLADPILPDLVKRRGVSVKKKSPSVLMIVNLFSPDNRRDNLYLSNYATIQLNDELSRLPGVGDITYIGQRDYSMRLWLDPRKMAYRNLTANDIVTAIQQQNTQVAAGQIGQAPSPPGRSRSSP